MIGMAEPVEIDAAKVRAGIQKLAAEKPGIYTREDNPTMTACVNVVLVNGRRTPSCIVGSFLADMIGVDRVPASGDYNSTLLQLVQEGRITITPEARYLLGIAQVLQDSHKVTWQTIANTIYAIGRVGREFVDNSK